MAFPVVLQSVAEHLKVSVPSAELEQLQCLFAPWRMERPGRIRRLFVPTHGNRERDILQLVHRSTCR